MCSVPGASCSMRSGRAQSQARCPACSGQGREPISACVREGYRDEREEAGGEAGRTYLVRAREFFGLETANHENLTSFWWCPSTLNCQLSTVNYRLSTVGCAPRLPSRRARQRHAAPLEYHGAPLVPHRHAVVGGARSAAALHVWQRPPGRSMRDVRLAAESGPRPDELDD